MSITTCDGRPQAEELPSMADGGEDEEAVEAVLLDFMSAEGSESSQPTTIFHFVATSASKWDSII